VRVKLSGANANAAVAQAVGAGGKTWRAYLSTQAMGGAPAINARDRIGRGPWQNFKGEDWTRWTWEPIMKSVYRYRQERHFAKPPPAIWPFVSDTARMVELCGFAPYRFEERVDVQGRVRRFAHGPEVARRSDMSAIGR
jgi:hypothetical protein